MNTRREEEKKTNKMKRKTKFLRGVCDGEEGGLVLVEARVVGGGKESDHHRKLSFSLLEAMPQKSFALDLVRPNYAEKRIVLEKVLKEKK